MPLGGRPFGTSDDEVPDPGITGLTGGVTTTPNPGTGEVTAVVTPVDLDDLIRSRCRALTGMDQFSYWSDPFLTVPSQRGSLWTALHYPSGIPDWQRGDVPGGVWRMVCNVGYEGAVIDPIGNYPFAAHPSSFIGTAAQTLSYHFARFRIPFIDDPAFDFNPVYNAFVCGFVDPFSLKVVGVGCALGETHFGAVGGSVNGVAGLTEGVATSTILDNAWHSMELFRRTGADAVKRWFVSIDGGAAVECGTVVDAAFTYGQPILEVTATESVGAPQPIIEIDHVGYAAQSNLPAMSANPTPPGP